MHIYSTDGDNITQQHQLDVSGEVTTVSYSPNGENLAFSGYEKTTYVFETSAYKVSCSYAVLHGFRKRRRLVHETFISTKSQTSYVMAIL